ncbi:YfjI family protein [Nonomuraea sp. NPDC046570]|uniref:YfjI family protein n=1 Tax=Nonomuraea sp. NPDC046570 TaxID=3155255 RepID=UPI0033C54946
MGNRLLLREVNQDRTPLSWCGPLDSEPSPGGASCRDDRKKRPRLGRQSRTCPLLRSSPDTNRKRSHREVRHRRVRQAVPERTRRHPRTPLPTRALGSKHDSSPSITEAEVARRLAVDVAEKAARTASAARGEAAPEAVAEAQSAALTVEGIKVPVLPRLVADDITPETAASLLSEQGGRLAILSAEGGIFATLAGRYSGTPNLDLFLKGHAGDALIIDRRGRTERVDDAALTLGLAVQPEIIADIATMPGFRGKGLLGRILYSLPTSNIGYRRIDPPPVPEHVAARYDANLQQLTIGMHDWDDPARLLLSPDATEVFTEHRRTTETRLRPHSGDLGHITDWAGKFDGAVMRIAGLLHLATHVEDGWRRPISAQTVHAAITLGQYFTAHALATFDAMGADPDVEAARTVHAWLHRTHTTRFTVREAFTALPRSRFRKVTELEPALDLLEQLGWIRREPDPPRTGPGRRPSPAYAVHPNLHQPGS